MKARSIFVAYPFVLGQAYRDALAHRFQDAGVEFRYADEELSNGHVMAKICRMMSEADVCMFDVSRNNPNVLFELGYSLGATQPGFVVINEDAVEGLNADLMGWDQVRYRDFEELAEKVFQYIEGERVPAKRSETYVPGPSARDIMHQLKFGSPPSSSPRLIIYALPQPFDRHYLSREVLGTTRYSTRLLCEHITAAVNSVRNDALWPLGYDHDREPGPDFIEVFHRLGGTEKAFNFRAYTSGAMVYSRVFFEDENLPFLDRSRFEENCTAAFTAMSIVREAWGFSEQRVLEVGTIFRNAEELRVSEDRYAPRVSVADLARLDEPSPEIWLPDIPIIVPADKLLEKAPSVTEEISANLHQLLVAS